MRVLLIWPSGGKGAPEFRREALACQRLLNARDHTALTTEFRSSARKAARCADLEHVVGGFGPHAVGFFCHGGKSWLQPGWRTSGGLNVESLAEALRESAVARVVLYACSTAGGLGVMGDGGFADRLRDLSGCEVFGHVGPGHTTRRPYLRRFAGGAPGVGGEWVVVPPKTRGMDGTGPEHGHTPEAWAAWKRRLKGPGRFAALLGEM